MRAPALSNPQKHVYIFEEVAHARESGLEALLAPSEFLRVA